ncbi:MAG: hypothetical protein J6Z08_07990 [Elusimicrobiales bacterium]|nr:hypothetical protein [Elusimicrobiales bacterium]
MKNKNRFAILKFFDKIRTSVYRRAIYLKFGSGYRHVHAYWPDIKFDFQPDGSCNVFYKGRKLYTTHSFDDLLNKKYDELTVFGAGPSVNQMDIAKVSPGTALLVNGAMALADRLPGGPFMCMALDYAFLWNGKKMIESLPEGTKLLLSDSFISYTIRKYPGLLDKFELYVTHCASQPYMAKEIAAAELPDEYFIKGHNSAFSLNPQKGLFDGGTILTWALQMTHYLRAGTTFICGLDLGNFNLPHFYEKKHDSIKSTGLLRDYEKIENFMRLAAEAFKKDKLKIFNCSPVSKLPYTIFPFSGHFLKKTANNTR